MAGEINPQTLLALQQAAVGFLENPDGQSHAGLANAVTGLVNSGHMAPQEAVQFLSNAPPANNPAMLSNYVKQTLDAINAHLAQNVAQSGVRTPSLGPLAPVHSGDPSATTTEQAQVESSTGALRHTQGANWYMNQLRESMPVGILGQGPVTGA